ncbi:MAG: NAD(P)H-hydrate epimerase [Planctomycetota bacterium]
MSGASGGEHGGEPGGERLLLVAEARAIDADARDRLGLPTLLLMENAARGVAEAAAALGERFVVLAGAGNHGGDGLAAARHLGWRRCAIHLLAEPDAQTAPDAALQLHVLRAAGVPVVVGALPDLAAHAGAVWIDALFGTGLARPLAGAARAWVDACNAARGRKLAVDIPSGLHGDTGEVLGAAVRADVTVTFVARKRGMATPTGRAHCGRVVVANLGLP